MTILNKKCGINIYNHNCKDNNILNNQVGIKKKIGYNM